MWKLLSFENGTTRSKGTEESFSTHNASLVVFALEIRLFTMDSTPYDDSSAAVFWLWTGLSKVASCRRKSPPTWSVSAGYSVWHFFTDGIFLNKTSLDWPLTLTTQPSISKLSDNPDHESLVWKSLNSENITTGSKGTEESFSTNNALLIVFVLEIRLLAMDSTAYDDSSTAVFLTTCMNHWCENR